MRMDGSMLATFSFFSHSRLMPTQKIRIEPVRDRLESAGMDFHRKVYEGYREAARLYPDRIVSVDARPSADKVFAAVLAALERAGVKL